MNCQKRLTYYIHRADFPSRIQSKKTCVRCISVDKFCLRCICWLYIFMKNSCLRRILFHKKSYLWGILFRFHILADDLLVTKTIQIEILSHHNDAICTKQQWRIVDTIIILIVNIVPLVSVKLLFVWMMIVILEYMDWRAILQIFICLHHVFVASFWQWTRHCSTQRSKKESDH